MMAGDELSRVMPSCSAAAAPNTTTWSPRRSCPASKNRPELSRPRIARSRLGEVAMTGGATTGGALGSTTGTAVTV
jgi:hypothetical protein